LSPSIPQLLQYWWELLGQAPARCLYYTPNLTRGHNIADFLIALAYFTYPVLLLRYWPQLKYHPRYFNGLITLALFILACGSTHLLSVITSYTPIIRFSLAIKFFTAFISWVSVVILYHLTSQSNSSPPFSMSLSAALPSSLNPITSYAFLAVTATVVTILGVIYSNTSIFYQYRSIRNLASIRDERDLYYALRSSLLSAERSQRGFLLTNDSTYLVPYDQARTALLKFHYDPQLTPLFKSKIAEMDQTVSLVKAKQLPQALKLVHSNEGLQLTQEIETIIANRQQSLGDQIAELITARDVSATGAQISITLASITSTGLLLLILGQRSLDLRQNQEYTRAIQAAQDRFDSFMNNSPFYAFIRDNDGHLLYLNQPYQNLFAPNTTATWDSPELTTGLSPEAMIIKNHGLKVLTSGEPITFEQTMVLPSKEERVWLTSLFPLPNPDGQLNLAGTAIDITELKQLEKLQAETHEKTLRAEAAAAHSAEVINILDSITDASFAVDVHWNLLYVNREWELLYAKNRTSVLGHPFWEICPWLKETIFEATYQQVMDERQSRIFEGFSPKVKRWVEVRAFPSDNGGLVAYIHDITARMQVENQQLHFLQELEAKVAERTSELNRSNAELEQFAYIASHDLQEPLRMVTSYLQLLVERYSPSLDSDAQEFIGYAVDGAQRMKELILALLDFSRAARTINKDAVTTPAEAAARLALTLRPTLEETHTTLNWHYPPDLTIHMEREQLNQVLQNLVTNSIKYQPPDQEPLIDITCQDHSHHTEITVKDNGIGIDPKHYDKLFILFRRLQPRGKYPGTGIGLAIVKRVVEAYGGKVGITPSDSGSIFFFTVPK
jgi:PAS domain S-box-containing protein